MGQYSSYYLYQKYEKRGEQDWIPCYPNVFSMSGDSQNPMPFVLRSDCDPQCGCSSFLEQWVNLDPTVVWVCEGTTKYYKQQKQISFDGGITWINQDEYRKGALIESSSSDCGESRYAWNLVSGYICDDCEQVKAKLSDSANTYTVVYDNSHTLTRAEIESAITPQTIEYAVIGDFTIAIGDGCFSGCSAMEYIRIPYTVTSIGDSAFRGCSAMTECSLPTGMQHIGNSAFTDSISLAFVNLPDGVLSIGTSAFQNCLNFRYINIPTSLTSIPNYCFYNCDGLSDIELHEGITSIGDAAFAECSGLYTVTLGSNAFYGASSNLKIYVPSASVDIYKAASGWSNYANKIYAIQ